MAESGLERRKAPERNRVESGGHIRKPACEPDAPRRDFRDRERRPYGMMDEARGGRRRR